MMALKAVQLKCIEHMLEDPQMSNVKLAEKVGVNRNTISNWKHNEDFMKEYQKQLHEVWKDAERIAVKSMIDLAKEKNFQASKYILDCFDYGPTQKIEAKVDAKAQVVIIDDLMEVE